MRKQLLQLCTCVLLCSSPVAFALDPVAEVEGDWSWRDGLLGDGSSRPDPFADGENIPGYMCEECRDPNEHPMDFAAFAFNGFFGNDPWMWDSKLGIPFRIYNLDMHYVVVWFEGMIFDSITFLPDTLDIRLRLQSGQILTFTVLQNGPELPIGDPDPDPPEVTGGCGCGSDYGSGEGEDEYSDPDEGLPEPPDTPDPSGVVTIVDPDEDDEFPEWEL